MASKKAPKKESVKKNIAPQASKSGNDSRDLWIGFAVICILAFLIYAPSFGNNFVNLDDDRYMGAASQPFSLKDIFSSYVWGNYHPFTIIVYQIIHHFAALEPKDYHIASFLFHVINAGLVLYLFYLLTGSVIIPVIVSLLFAIHPMHVESVAWASELKDVLYTGGFLASLIYYVKYSKTGEWKFYIASVLFFVFSVLSKGMAVCLPLVLLLLDFFTGKKIKPKIIIEKIPFFIISLIFGMVAIKAQTINGKTTLSQFNFIQHVAFASYGTCIYLLKFILPVKLSAYYPYPKQFSSVYYLYMLGAIIILGATVYSLKKNRKIFFGIAFFFITILSVLQLLPVGDAIMADRYTYLPYIGLCYLVAEGFVYLRERQKAIAYSVIGIVTVVFCFIAYQRTEVWHDSEQLWTDVLSRYPEMNMALYDRGAYYIENKQFDKALADFDRIPDSTYSSKYAGRGFAYDKMNKPSEAIANFNKAIALDTGYIECYYIRGRNYYKQNDFNTSLIDFNHILRMDSTNADYYYCRALAHYHLAQNDKACADYRSAVKLGYKNQPLQAFINICK